MIKNIRRGPGLTWSSPHRRTGVWLQGGDVPGLWWGWRPSGVVWVDGAARGYKTGHARTPWGAAKRIRENRRR